MMRVTRIALGTLAVLAVGCAAGIPIRARYTVTVRVQNEDRVPIPGALVQFDAYKLPPTDVQGETSATLARGEYTMQVGAEGYKPRAWVVDVIWDWNMGIGLERIR